MQELQPFQISLQGRHLIEASAGTGKTFNIATLFVRTLIEKDLDIGNILVVTYTEAATKELKDRLQNRLQLCFHVLKNGNTNEDPFFNKFIQSVSHKAEAAERIQYALHNFDEAAVYTIHGFCYQALQEQAFQSNTDFDMEMVGSDTDILQEVVDDFWRQFVAEFSNDKTGNILLDLLLDEGISPDTLADELGGIASKPYLELLPEDTFDAGSRVDQLHECYQWLQSNWNDSRPELRELLLSNPMNGNRYQERYLDSWFPQMDDFLAQEDPPVACFEKFSRFTQSYVDDSLKKSAEKNGAVPPQHPFFKHAERYLNILEELRSYPAYFKKEVVQHIQENLPLRKRKYRVLSYDDLLNNLNESLSGSKGKRLASLLRKKYPVALVDEFQDTDPVQYEIFSKIYPKVSSGEAGLFMIGDPKQSIYSFRGADVFAYLKAKKEIDESRRHDLKLNYRSTPGLIRALNTIFSEHSNPFLVENIPYVPVTHGRVEDSYDYFLKDGTIQPPVQFHNLADSADEIPVNKGTADKQIAKFTAQQVVEYIEDPSSRIGSKKVSGSDIAVLVRTHNQADIIREALLEKDIKSVQYSQKSVFESTEAGELYQILKSVAEPKNEEAVIAALSTRILGFDAEQLVALQNEEQEWISITDLFAEWNRQWNDYGVAHMLRSLQQEMQVDQRAVSFKGGERLITNFRHLTELLQNKQEEGRGSIRDLLHWFAKKRQNPDSESEEEQIRLESDENLVKIVTMHRSKGLQYPIVFCPFLWRASQYSDRGKPVQFHDKNSGQRVFVDFTSQKNEYRLKTRYLAAQEELAESMRLAYVAMTRAQQCCIIPWIQAKKIEISPFGYLLDPELAVKKLKEIISYEDTYSSVKEHYYSKPIEHLQNRLAKIDLPSVDMEEEEDLEDKQEPIWKSARTFSPERSLYDGVSISSFSSLVYKEHKEDNDFFNYYDGFGEQEKMPEASSQHSIFTFPRGPQAGSCIHQIFEEIDFQNPQNLASVVSEQLYRFGIDLEWEPVIRKHVLFTLDRPLLPESNHLKLSALPEKNRVPEMEFYFKSESIELAKLITIIRRKEAVSEGHADPGFLKGFIDLTFVYKGRYYLLDYKSNHLGGDVKNYGSKSMKNEVIHHMYDLQYHLYSIALHRFLDSTITNYSYKKHFGGAFYLFVRGLNSGGREGIFFDRPDYRTIEELDNYLRTGNS